MERTAGEDLPELALDELQLLGSRARCDDVSFACVPVGDEWHVIANTHSVRQLTRTLLTLTLLPIGVIGLTVWLIPGAISRPLAVAGVVLFSLATVATWIRHQSMVRQWRRLDPLLTWNAARGELTCLARSVVVPVSEIDCLLILSLPTRDETATELQLVHRKGGARDRLLLLRAPLEGTFPWEAYLRPFAARSGIVVVKAWQRQGVNDERPVMTRI